MWRHLLWGGESGGQQILVKSPFGGETVVIVPENCTTLAVQMPNGQPISVSKSVPMPLGLDFTVSPAGGVAVAEVYSDSNASQAGITAGMRIIRVNGQVVPASNDPVSECIKLVNQGTASTANTVELQVSSWMPAVRVHS